MYPRSFDYTAPTTLEEAFGALGDDAKVMAGRISLIPLMKMRLFSPALIVDIGNIAGLDSITDHGDTISIGALVRHGETASSDVVMAGASALATAASLTGDPLVRNRGTTCGALAHADVAGRPTCRCPGLRGGDDRTVSVGDPRDRRVGVLCRRPDVCVESRRNPDVYPAPQGRSRVKVRLTTSSADEVVRSDYAVAGAAAWVKKSL